MVHIIAELSALAWPLSECLGVTGCTLLSHTAHGKKGQLAESGWTLCFSCPAILYLSVLPRLFDTEETKRQGHASRGLQSKQMLALGLLENFQMNYFSVENSFLTKRACLWNVSASHG